MSVKKNKVIGLSNLPTIWDCINKDFVSVDKFPELVGEISPDNIEIFFKNQDSENNGNASLSLFRIDNIDYYFTSGMTWEEWVNSSYNNGVFEIINDSIKYVRSEYYVSNGSELIRKNSTIIAQTYYLVLPNPNTPESPAQYTFTIIPTPADATVVFKYDGKTVEGKTSVTVPNKTSVSWSVSCEGYTTKSGTEYIDSPRIIYIDLEGTDSIIYYTLTIDTDPTNTVEFEILGTTYTGKNYIRVKKGETVKFTVSRRGYVTVSRSVVMDADKEISVTLGLDESQLKNIVIKKQKNFGWGEFNEEFEEIYNDSTLCYTWEDFLSLYLGLAKNGNDIIYGNHHKLYVYSDNSEWVRVDINEYSPSSRTYALLYTSRYININNTSYIIYKNCTWEDFVNHYSDEFFIDGDRVVSKDVNYGGYYVSLNNIAVNSNGVISDDKYDLSSSVSVGDYKFYIDGKQYTIEAGKQFKDWVNSEDNTGGFYCLDDYDYIFKHTLENYQEVEDNYVKYISGGLTKSYVIKDGQQYFAMSATDNNCLMFKIEDANYIMFFEDDRLIRESGELYHNITWSDFIERNNEFVKDGENLLKHIDGDPYYMTLNDKKIQINDLIHHDETYSIEIDESSERISFTIDGSTYYATQTMTWKDWVGSDKHNIDGFKIDGFGYIVNSDENRCIENVFSDNRIISDEQYTLTSYSVGKFCLSYDQAIIFEYNFVTGMTWEDWVKHNKDNWYINDKNEIISSDDKYKIDISSLGDTIESVTYDLVWMNKFKIVDNNGEIEYAFESGMTWEGWVNSIYNTGDFEILNNKVVKRNDGYIINILNAKPSNFISIGNIYKLVIEFTIDGAPKYALYGMTWEDWANDLSISSNYSTFDGDDGVYYTVSKYKKLKLGDKYINKTDKILTNDNLTTEEVTSFSIIVNGESKVYGFDQGMLWGDWVGSDYNPGNIFNNSDTTDTQTYYKDADGNLYRIGFGDITFEILPITYKTDLINGLGEFYVDGRPYKCVFTEYGGGAWERWINSMYNDNNEITFKQANLEISSYVTDYVYSTVAEKFIYDENGVPQSKDSVIKSGHHYTIIEPTGDNTTDVKYRVAIKPTPADAIVTVTYYEDDILNKSSSQGNVSMSVDSGTNVYYTAEYEGYVSTSGYKKVSTDENINVILKESQQSPWPRSSTFTIIPSPADANVTLTCDGYDTIEGTGETSITVDRMNWISYIVSCDGYDTKTGKCLLYLLDKAEIITLNETAEELPTINAPKPHSLSIDGVEINYLIGQTWRDWVSSPYNTHDAKIEYLSGVECVTFPSDSNYYCKILMYDGWGYTPTQPDNSMHSRNRFQEIGVFVLDEEIHHFQSGHTWEDYLNSEFNNTKFDYAKAVNGGVYPAGDGQFGMRTIIKTTANFEEWELADNIIEHEGEYKNACIYDKSKKYSFSSDWHFPECKYYSNMDWESWLQSDLNVVGYYYDPDLKIITNGENKLVGNSNYNITKPGQKVTGKEDLYSYIFFYLDGNKMMATAAYGKDVVYWGDWVNGNAYFIGDDGSIFSRDGQRHVIDVGTNTRIVANGNYYTKSITDMGKPYVYHSQDSTSNNYVFRIQPNTMHIWDEVENLNIIFAAPEIYDGYSVDSMSSEYIIQFKCPSDKIPQINWPKYPIVGHIGFKPGKIYKCSLMDNILSILEYDDDGNYSHTAQTLNHKSLDFDYNVVGGEYVGCGPVGIKYSSYPIKMESGGDSVNRIPKTNTMRVWRNVGNSPGGLNIKLGKYNPSIRSQETFAVVISEYNNISVTLPSDIKWVNGSIANYSNTGYGTRMTPIYQISCFGGLATSIIQTTNNADVCNHVSHNREHSASGYGIVTISSEKLQSVLKNVNGGIMSLKINPYYHYIVNIEEWVNGDSLGLDLLNMDGYTMNEYIVQLEIGNVENIPISFPKHVKLTNSITYNKDIVLEKNSIYQIFVTNNLATIIRVRK